MAHDGGNLDFKSFTMHFSALRPALKG